MSLEVWLSEQPRKERLPSRAALPNRMVVRLARHSRTAKRHYDAVFLSCSLSGLLSQLPCFDSARRRAIVLLQSLPNCPWAKNGGAATFEIFTTNQAVYLIGPTGRLQLLFVLVRWKVSRPKGLEPAWGVGPGVNYGSEPGAGARTRLTRNGMRCVGGLKWGSFCRNNVS